MAGWSSLPGDLINRIADRVLDTEDLDYYMDFRAVCHSWRAATADAKNRPCDDPRFQLRRWVMLDEVHQSETRLFVNAATGRFVRKDLRVLLRRYFLIARAFGIGLLVLAERSSPDAVCLVNPFTGSLTRFMAPLPSVSLFVTHVVGYAPPTVILLCDFSGSIYGAAPDSESFVLLYNKKQAGYSDRLICQALICGIYASARENGMAPSLLAPESNRILGLVAKRFAEESAGQAKNCSFLVESAGEMLMVFNKPLDGIEVFKFVSGSNMLEPVNNIGSRALFVGNCRCLSVDADKFTSVEANTIYYVEGMSSYSVRIYSLQGRHETAGWWNNMVSSTFFSLNDSAPLSVVQLLCRYTFHAQDPLLGWGETVLTMIINS